MTPVIAAAAVHPTTQRRLDEAVARLREAAPTFARLPIPDRIALARSMQAGYVRVADQIVRAACVAKGIPAGTPVEGEEWATGPWPVIRQLRLVAESLTSLQRTGNTPTGVVSRAADERLMVVERGRQGRNGARVAAVAESHGDVAEEAAALCALDRTSFEAGAELVVGHRKERNQLRRVEAGPRQERGLHSRGGLAVPGAHFLADVTAEDPIPDERPQVAQRHLIDELGRGLRRRPMRLPTALGPHLQGNAVRDLVEPGADGVVPARAGGLACQHQEGGLEGVVGVGVVAKHPPAHAEHQRPVPLHQRLEGTLLAAGEGLQELLVAALAVAGGRDGPPQVLHNQSIPLVGHSIPFTRHTQ